MYIDGVLLCDGEDDVRFVYCHVAAVILVCGHASVICVRLYACVCARACVCLHAH